MSRRQSGAGRQVAWLVACLVAGCAHPPPEPAPAPLPAVIPSGPMVAPRRAAGNYTLTTDLKTSQPQPPPGPRRPPRGRPAPAPLLHLDAQAMAAPDATATSRIQLAATVNIPGYTRAPAGRLGQAAVWWPLPGDSVVVHLQTPRGDGLMDLRGTMQGDTLAGEIWFTSTSDGTVFQMGTFRAVKQKR
jgi:hypothetical protein